MDSAIIANTDSLPTICNLQRVRNPHFMGREDILQDIERAFSAKGAMGKVQAIVGMGGAGKTSIAVEYAFSRRAMYDVIWWVRADSPATIASDLAPLALRLGETQIDPASTQEACRAVVQGLQRRQRWLLIFDNAQWPNEVAPYLAWGGDGHVLITSRNMQWAPMAVPSPVQPWTRDESIAFLRLRLKGFRDGTIMAKLALALGDLPLALEQAAACIEQTKISPAEYLRQFEIYWGELLLRGKPSGDYPTSAAMAWELSFRQIEAMDGVAASLMNLCAFFGNEEIPWRTIYQSASFMPDPLKQALSAPSQIESSAATLRQFSLAELVEKSVSIHPVVAILARERLTPENRAAWATAALQAASADFPFDNHDPSGWTQCAQALPHLLASAQHARHASVRPGIVADVLDRAGRYLLRQEQFGQARQVLEEALELVKSSLGASNPKAADLANNLGRVYHRMGDNSGAMKLFESAMEIDGQLYGPADPHMASVANNFGMTLASLGELQRAREKFEWALEVCTKRYGQQHRKVASIMNNLGYVLFLLNDTAAARQNFEKAMAITQAANGANHPNVARIAINLAGALKAEKQYVSALQLLDRAMRIDEMVFGPNHAKVARDLAKIGELLRDTGDAAGSVGYFDRAAKISEITCGPDHPITLGRFRDLGNALERAGEPARADEYLRRAMIGLKRRPAQAPVIDDPMLTSLGVNADDSLGEDSPELEMSPE